MRTKILCLIDTRNICACTYRNTYKDTKTKSSESGREVGKGTLRDLAKGPVGLGNSFQKSPGEKQEERVTFWAMTVENCQKEGGANSRDWGIYGNQPSELGTSMSHVPSLWYQ